MPKVTNTRRDRAKKVLELIKSGPTNIREDPKLAERYDLWFNSWLARDLIDLIPELREIRDQGNRCKYCRKRPHVVRDVYNETRMPGAYLAVCTVACKEAKRYYGATRKLAIDAWNADNPSN